ncbi:hypothetical protein D9757_005181 [Collybiopsis confluens]|uniref:F-box domain-containing protein n=1 Tax=Collybiopsis confluens TaxID=2823264 RepID=A0A8H5MDZ6_9AGAR|nr:hypothetical protein D9757_005181 [Collybiopsis confluens]
MTIQLPTEIWWRILDYLPSNKVKQLGRVNRAFLEKARQSRYQSLVIYEYDKKTKRRLEKIRSSSLGHYVRSLTLCVQAWPASELIRWDGQTGDSLSVVDRVRSLFDSHYLPRKTVALKKKRLDRRIELIFEAMTAFEHIQEYELIWEEYDQDCPEEFIPEVKFASSLMTIFLSMLVISPLRGTLTKLSLQIPTHIALDCLAAADFPFLEDLKVFLWKSQCSRAKDWDILTGYLGSENLAKFISGLSSTLQTLSISRLDPSINLDRDFGRVFDLLCKTNFPFLRSFDFCTRSRYLRKGTPSLDRFVRQISHSVRSLKLSHLAYDTSSSSPLHHLDHRSWISNVLSVQQTRAFSSLTSLRIKDGSLCAHLADLSALLTSVAHQLGSFFLEDNLLTLKEVETVVCSLSHSSSPLRYLGIEPRDLAPDTFDLLVCAFPGLRELSLSFERFTSSDDDVIPMTEEDVRCMFPNLCLDLGFFCFGLMNTAGATADGIICLRLRSAVSLEIELYLMR